MKIAHFLAVSLAFAGMTAGAARAEMQTPQHRADKNAKNFEAAKKAEAMKKAQGAEMQNSPACEKQQPKMQECFPSVGTTRKKEAQGLRRKEAQKIQLKKAE